jgi:hypothetical protein
VKRITVGLVLLCFAFACKPKNGTDGVDHPSTGGTSGSGASPNASPSLSDEIEPDALWVAKDGSDSNPGTAEAPFATLAHGFERLSPGRMLVVRDGTYNEPVFSYYRSGIPSGKEDDYTVVRAEHDFGVTINAAGFTGREAVQRPLELEGEPVQYIHIRGIRFRANPEGQADAALINYANHVKITRCAFFDAPDSGGAHVATVRNSEYVLLEECHAWGGGRYKFLVFESDRTVLRRCVGRYDRYDSPPDAMPMGVFSSYLSTNTALENCIAIDSDQEQYYLTSGRPGTLWGGFYFPNGGSAGARVMGSIALNMGGLAGLYNDQAVGSQEVENTVVWDSRGGVFYAGDRASVSVSHATVGAITGKTADESYAWGTGVYCFDGLSECNVRNSLLTQCSEFGVADWLTSDYNDFFDNGQGAYGKIRYEASAPTPGANDLQVDPGLRYLPRPESGSALVGAASDGGAMGATILYRYGATGSVWGDPGWDQLTDEPLWPFPNEAEIKKDMASFAGPPDGTRGFCAPGNGLYGGPITLTSYIWEYLGNPCPADICGS